MKMDYNKLSKTYDLTRDKNINTLKIIIGKGKINKNSFVLDFGCGTGNYTCAVKKVTGANVFGVDASEGMIEKANEKSEGTDIKFKIGDHNHIPAKEHFFDLIYMTDVIHHVDNIEKMFSEFARVLNKKGIICIVTESHNQIKSRAWSGYFPATVTADQNRYPAIDEIVEAAKKNKLKLDAVMNTDCEHSFKITPEFFQLVEKKGYSMFKLISDEEFAEGMRRITEDYKNQKEIKSNHGETFLWFKK